MENTVSSCESSSILTADRVSFKFFSLLLRKVRRFSFLGESRDVNRTFGRTEFPSRCNQLRVVNSFLTSGIYEGIPTKLSFYFWHQTRGRIRTFP